MATGSYLSIITLNVNRLNAPTKTQILAESIQKKQNKRKTYNQDYSTQQGSHSDSKEKPKALQAKAERIQHHQTALQQMPKDPL